MNKLSDLVNKIRHGNGRSKKAITNVFFSFLYKGGNMVINLMLVPLTIDLVNKQEYGIWLTISSIVAWFSISDIGFGNGLRNKFAEAVAKGETLLAKSYVSTTYIALACLTAIMWVVFFVINYLIDWSVVLNVDLKLEQQLSLTMIIFFSFFSIQFVVKLVGTVLIANQDSGTNAGIVFISNILLIAGIYLLKFFVTKGSLVDLALVTGASQVVVYFFASIWYFNNQLKPYRPSIKLFNKKHIKSLMNLGIKFFIIQISMIFVFQSTNIIIAQLLGPEVVTTYNISYKLFTIPMTIAMIAASPLWSAFTDAYTKGDIMWMKKIFRYLNVFTFFIYIVLFGFLLLSPSLYRVWLGSKVEIPYLISILMMVNVLFATTFNLYIFIINGIGKLFLQVRLNVILSILYIPLGIFLGKRYGLPGIISANIFVNFIFSIAIPFQSWLLINNRGKGLLNR